MDYDRIILEMLDRIKALEEDVGTLKKAGAVNALAAAPEDSSPTVGKKYFRLAEYLSDSGKNQIRLSFDKIEELIGAKLPDSAREHRAFWANTTSHSIALSWLSRNYKTVEVNMEEGTVLFERNRGTRISDYMEELVNGIVERNGVGYEMSAQEIRQRMKDAFGVNPSSVLPADYCYNRINRGIHPSKQPMLFEFDGESTYRCLGSCYPYNGKVFHRPKGESSDSVVGFCKDGERHIYTEYEDYFSDAPVSINYLWMYGNEASWRGALNHYFDLVPDQNMPLEREMESLCPETLEAMTDREFYDFLHDKYFVWKYTQKNRLATTRMHLKKYISENRLNELGNIKKQLFAANLDNPEECLSLVTQIRGLGPGGASGLLALLYPRHFGSVDQFVVKSLLKITGLKEREMIEHINPEAVKPAEATILMRILQEKARELNAQFHSDFWTPRKLDMILWAADRD